MKRITLMLAVAMLVSSTVGCGCVRRLRDRLCRGGHDPRLDDVVEQVARRRCPLEPSPVELEEEALVRPHGRIGDVAPPTPKRLAQRGDRS